MNAIAAVCEETGPNAGLVVKEVEVPEPGPDQVAIDVRAAAVNLNETIKLKGTHHEKPIAPLIPGGEIAGVVRKVGGKVTRFKEGDRVAAMLPGSVGGWATAAVADEGKVMKIPDEMSFEVACGFCGGALTAYDALVAVGELKPEDRLVITGAAGGVGLAGIQIAKAIGAEVVAIAGGPEKGAMCKQAGADHVIDHQQEDVVDAVYRIFGPDGATIVMESVGGDTQRKAMKYTGFGGRVVLTGYTSYEIPEVKTIHIMLKGIQLRGTHLALRGAKQPERVAQMTADLFKLYTDGKLKVEVCKVFPLKDAQAAIDYIGQRRHIGKVVLQVSGENGQSLA